MKMTAAELKQIIIDALNAQGGGINEFVVTKLAEFAALPGTDLTALQSAVTDIQTAIDGDPSQPGYQFLTNLTTRLTAIEVIGDKNKIDVVALQGAVSTAVEDFNTAISNEITARTAAVKAVDDKVILLVSDLDAEKLKTSSNSTTITTLQGQIATAISERSALTSRVTDLESGKLDVTVFEAFKVAMSEAWGAGYAAFHNSLWGGASNVPATSAFTPAALAASSTGDGGVL